MNKISGSRTAHQRGVSVLASRGFSKKRSAGSQQNIDHRASSMRYMNHNNGFHQTPTCVTFAYSSVNAALSLLSRLSCLSRGW